MILVTNNTRRRIDDLEYNLTLIKRILDDTTENAKLAATASEDIQERYDQLKRDVDQLISLVAIRWHDK
jgi:hypothetical protein